MSNASMKLNVITMSFAGQSLRVITGFDVITGNKQHELLFVASDAVKMAGLEKQASTNARNRYGDNANCMKLNSLLECGIQIDCLSELKYHGN